ncbi:MAG: hypothetical protein HY815_06265 [Candidatus Riflebacteria bacterium]|nr:hypothetical protein [Candidatus Riflebacteria bacterium]
MRDLEEERVARNYLIRWCIIIGVVAVVVGALLPFLVSSPPYPSLG